MTLFNADLALRPDGTLGPLWMQVTAEGEFAAVSETPIAGTPVPLRGLVVPGVPNLHSHAFQRGLAGRTERARVGEADSFWTWRQAMYAYLAQLGPDEVEAIATRLYVEMLEAGYTRVVEFHYLHRDPSGAPYADPGEMAFRLMRAAARAGIGLTLLPVVYDAGGFEGTPLSDAQRRFRMSFAEAMEISRQVSTRDATVQAGIALHSLRGVSPSAFDEFLDARRDWAAGPVHIHVAEQTREVEECVALTGARPVQWLMDHAPVDSDWCLVHATHVTTGELDRMVEARAVVGLCPTTEANLGDGLFPLEKLLSRGGTWGIGSDSHSSVDPAEELRWLEYGQRLGSRSRNVASTHTGGSTGGALIAGALEGGARASGQALGALAVGRAADLVVLDLDHPVFAGHDPTTYLDAWIFSGNGRPVRQVMVRGCWVVENGRHPEAESSLEAYRRALRPR